MHKQLNVVIAAAIIPKIGTNIIFKTILIIAAIIHKKPIIFVFFSKTSV